MIFNEHSKLEGKHALLSPSGYHWLNYDNPDSFYAKYKSQYSQTVGTLLHAFAEERIRYKLDLEENEQKSVLQHLLRNGIPRSVIDINYIFDNLRSYVNDAIGFRMEPEVVLMYSDNCFGTADAISFRNNKLRIHDLKTGSTPAHMEQLEIYAALFFLEYKKLAKPADVDIELRLYQSNEENEPLIFRPEPSDITQIMKKIREADRQISKLRAEG